MEVTLVMLLWLFTLFASHASYTSLLTYVLLVRLVMLLWSFKLFMLVLDVEGGWWMSGGGRVGRKCRCGGRLYVEAGW